LQTKSWARDPRATHGPAQKASDTARGSIAARVSAQLIDALQHGVKPWTPPWDAAAALALPLRHNGAAYRGGNILILWAAAQAQGYSPRTWLSFRQAREIGGFVRRGERATHITYYSRNQQAEPEDPTAGEVAPHARTQRAFVRTYAVFNAAQIEGLPAHFYATPAPPADCDETSLKPMFCRVPAAIEHGGARACYNPATDTIHLPPRQAFISTSQYYATLLHELGHWTGHAIRLDRELAGPRSATAYAREELVAELCSAFLGAELGLPVDHLECHAAYLDHWLKLLDREPGALLSAAAKAQAAADYLRPFLVRVPPETE
jgi:antirestriction protein ArdC